MSCFSEIFNWLLEVDQSLLLLGNGFHTPFLDSLMWMISDRWIWVPLYALLTVFVFRRAGWKGGIICMIMIGLLITAVDQTCATFLRPELCRLRPSNPDNPLSAMVQIVNGYRSGSYGFPSCHAANTFALALYLSLFFQKRAATIFFIIWSIVVSYSRIYLGVHYPGDVIAGFIIGGFFAVLCYRLLILIVAIAGRYRYRLMNV